MSRKRNLESAAQDAPAATGQKRRKQYTEEDAKLASIYNNLAEESRDVRLSAAKELVLKLSSDPAAELANKVIVRLIKGLNSGRKAARFGFFIAFTETLRQLYSPSSKEIPGLDPNIYGLGKLVAELTTVDGKAPGQVRHCACRSQSHKLTQPRRNEITSSVVSSHTKPSFSPRSSYTRTHPKNAGRMSWSNCSGWHARSHGCVKNAGSSCVTASSSSHKRKENCSSCSALLTGFAPMVWQKPRRALLSG